MSGMIVAPEPIAVEEGAQVLMKGGNAIDAAVTCAFTQFVVTPQNAGLAGYGGAILQLADAPNGSSSHTVVLDAPSLAGSKVTPTMWEDIIIGPDPDGWGYLLKGKVNDLGYQAISTPGIVKGLATMLKRWGTISWASAIAPAIRIAEEGFMVDEVLAMGWKQRAKCPEACWFLDYIKGNTEASRIYLKSDGLPYEAGEILRNPDYARTLRHLAQHGSDDFYRGELARRMSEDLTANGSFVTAQDLAEYELREVEPLVGTYRDYTIISSSAPNGGPTLLSILNILEGYDLRALGHNSPEYIYLVSMAMKGAFADRRMYLGDPEFVDVPLTWMVSNERAEEWRKRIDEGEEFTVSFTPLEPPDTTHLSVVDQYGNCVALTHSLGMSSGVITPGLGFIYNNSMIGFYPMPGHPNSIAPRKQRTSCMSAAIVYRGDRPVLVLGSPGGSKIVTSNVQVILNVLDFGMSISDAVLAPRFHCQGDVITCQMRIPGYVCDQVAEKHATERMPESHGGLGRVHAIAIDPATGRLSGAADAGAAGMALEVS